MSITTTLGGRYEIRRALEPIGTFNRRLTLKNQTAQRNTIPDGSIYFRNTATTTSPNGNNRLRSGSTWESVPHYIQLDPNQDKDGNDVRAIWEEVLTRNKTVRFYIDDLNWAEFELNALAVVDNMKFSSFDPDNLADYHYKLMRYRGVYLKNPDVAQGAAAVNEFADLYVDVNVDTKDGEDGPEGPPGNDGTDGTDGEDGEDGEDGVAGDSNAVGLIYYQVISDDAGEPIGQPDTPVAADGANPTTYDFTTGAFARLPSDWALTPPSVTAAKTTHIVWRSVFSCIAAAGTSVATGSAQINFTTPSGAAIFPASIQSDNFDGEVVATTPTYAYKLGTTYSKGATVIYQDREYLAKIRVTGNNPPTGLNTDNTRWKYLGADPEWYVSYGNHGFLLHRDSGIAILSDVYARGNIEASSIEANFITAEMINGDTGPAVRLFQFENVSGDNDYQTESFTFPAKMGKRVQFILSGGGGGGGSSRDAATTAPIRTPRSAPGTSHVGQGNVSGNADTHSCQMIIPAGLNYEIRIPAFRGGGGTVGSYTKGSNWTGWSIRRSALIYEIKSGTLSDDFQVKMLGLPGSPDRLGLRKDLSLLANGQNADQWNFTSQDLGTDDWQGDVYFRGTTVTETTFLWSLAQAGNNNGFYSMYPGDQVGWDTQISRVVSDVSGVSDDGFNILGSNGSVTSVVVASRSLTARGGRGGGDNTIQQQDDRKPESPNINNTNSVSRTNYAYMDRQGATGGSGDAGVPSTNGDLVFVEYNNETFAGKTVAMKLGKGGGFETTTVSGTLTEGQATGGGGWVEIRYFGDHR